MTTADEVPPALAAGKPPPASLNVARGIAWLAAARIVTMATGMVYTAIVARILSAHDFGIVAGVMILVALGVSLSDGAFALPLVQMPDLTDSLKRAAFWMSMTVGLGLAALIAALSGVLERLMGVSGLAAPLAVAALILPLRAMNGVAVAMLERRGEFRSLGMAQVAGNVLGLAVPAVVLAALGWGYWALIAGVLLQAALESALNIRAAPMRWLGPTTRGDALRLLRTGGPTTLTQVINWGSLSIPSLIVARSLGVLPLSYYSRGLNMLNLVVNLVGATVQRVLYPSFAALQSDPEKLNLKFRRALTSAVGLYALITAIFLVNAPAMILILLGPKWKEVTPLLQVLFLAFIPRCAYKVTEAFAMGTGRFVGVATRQAIYFGLCAVCTLAGVTQGVVGACAGFGVAVWIFYGLSLGQAVKVSRVGWGWAGRTHLMLLGAAAAVAAANLGLLHLVGKASLLSGVRLANPDLQSLAEHAMAGVVLAGALCGAAVLVPARLIDEDLQRARLVIARRIGLARVVSA